jgi:hypothetical protein
MCRSKINPPVFVLKTRARHLGRCSSKHSEVSPERTERAPDGSIFIPLVQIQQVKATSFALLECTRLAVGSAGRAITSVKVGARRCACNHPSSRSIDARAIVSHRGIVHADRSESAARRNSVGLGIGGDAVNEVDFGGGPRTYG